MRVIGARKGGRGVKPGTARLRINREVIEYDGGELSITHAMALVFLKQADTYLCTLVGSDLASQGKYTLPYLILL